MNARRPPSGDQTGIGSPVAAGLSADSLQAQPPTANNMKTFLMYRSVRRLAAR